MKPIKIGRAELYCGEALSVLKSMKSNSVDAVVTDPPAGISFMGKEWDKAEHKDVREARSKFLGMLTPIMRECLRVLKPGGHALVWALPRTSHWTALAIEEAGFEVRDRVAHLFGTGFPKSTDVGKQIDSLPNSKDAVVWDGWGSALKPACEDWWLCRKPLSEKTFAKNVLKWGTGAINIDACRISSEPTPINKLESWSGFGQKKRPKYVQQMNTKGRWPANVVHDGSDEVVDGFPVSKDGVAGKCAPGVGMFGFGGRDQRWGGYGGEGSAARFFYGAKASPGDRDEGLDDVKISSAGQRTGRKEGSAGINAYAGATGSARNHHPTVKATPLMRWLCRLITPPNGVVLDCFMGSGSTGKAALMEGFRFIGIEREKDYFEISRRRIAFVAKKNKNGKLKNHS